jgi:hypothetical protein
LAQVPIGGRYLVYFVIFSLAALYDDGKAGYRTALSRFLHAAGTRKVFVFSSLVFLLTFIAIFEFFHFSFSHLIYLSSFVKAFFLLTNL